MLKSPELLFTLFGLLVGSFLNVVIYRLPRLMSIGMSRSKCTSCGKQIHWYENIPVISYLFLRGKCSKCGSGISWRYPFVELVTALGAWFIAPEYITAESTLYFGLYFSVFCILLSQFMIDLEHKLLMDSLNLLLVVLFLVFAWLENDWAFSLIGGALGFGLPLAITWVFYKLRGVVGLGGGDIKLYGALGLYLGAQGIIHNMVFSCGVGAVLGGLLLAARIIKREEPIPFGPFIISVAIFQIYWPQDFQSIMSWVFG